MKIAKIVCSRDLARLLESLWHSADPVITFGDAGPLFRTYSILTLTPNPIANTIMSSLTLTLNPKP